MITHNYRLHYLILYRKKNGNQHAMKLPMISPRMRVARRSFFLARSFFSRSAASGVNLAAGIRMFGYLHLIPF